LIDEIRTSGYRDDKRDSLAVPWSRLTLSEVAEHVHLGADVLAEARDFLDGRAVLTTPTLQALTARRARSTSEPTRCWPRAASLARTPIALKRRRIFWPARSLERV
jgi:hypothetical protein